MGRTYAGILGVIAFLTVIGRGLIQEGGVESTMRLAVTSLLVMAVVGGVIGRLAAWFVEESIRWHLQVQLQAQRHRTNAEPARESG
jgi:hypothetical protein